MIESMQEICALALRLGQVDRVTLHADGVTPETDTTHTVMLAWVAPALVGRLGLSGRLDTGNVTEYAVVHDMLEAYCGDMDTQIWTPEKQALKDEMELWAKERFLDDHGASWPWLRWRLESYEAQTDPAARYVWAVDKMLPKLIQPASGYVQLLRAGLLPSELAESLIVQRRRIAERLVEPWFAPVLSVYDEVVKTTVEGYQLQWSLAKLGGLWSTAPTESST
jgi:5'-deoxynucleotidase YfbR-like HD superfamily hydrolase